VPSDALHAVLDLSDGTVVPVLLGSGTASGKLESYQIESNVVFGTRGSHTVTLHVRDEDGGEATTQLTVKVKGPPTVVQAEVNDGLSQRSYVNHLIVQFNEDVSVSLTQSSFVLRNSATQSAVTLNFNPATDYNPTTHVARLTFSALGQGSYRMTVLATGVSDSDGLKMSADLNFDFFVLTGDFNGDGVVNDQDVIGVWRNLLKAPASRDLNADLNGDGQVTAADLTVVKGHYLAVSTAGSSGQALNTASLSSAEATASEGAESTPVVGNSPILMVSTFPSTLILAVPGPEKAGVLLSPSTAVLLSASPSETLLTQAAATPTIPLEGTGSNVPVTLEEARPAESSTSPLGFSSTQLVPALIRSESPVPVGSSALSISLGATTQLVSSSTDSSTGPGQNLFPKALEGFARYALDQNLTAASSIGWELHWVVPRNKDDGEEQLG